MLWQGKPLKDYTKEELMIIVESIARIMRQQSARHAKDLDTLFDPKED